MRLRGWILFALLVSLAPDQVLAAIQDNNLLNSIVDAYRTKAAAWEPVLTGYAITLFWLLVTIDLVWNGIALALRGADLQEFTGELVRRIFFIGFFFALLTHSSDWAQAIIDSLRQAADAANAAAGGTAGISPSSIFDIGLTLAVRITDTVSFFSPMDSLGLIISSLIVMICFALIAAFMVIALIEMYFILYAAIIVLGLGGSGWTSSYAVNYVVYAFSVGMKLFAMQLLIGLGESFIRDWVTNFNENNAQVLLIIGAAVVMLALVWTIPDLLKGLINGTSFGSGAPMVQAARDVKDVAVDRSAAVAASVLALKEATQLAHAQGARGLGSLAKGAATNLARATADDIGGQFMRVPGHHPGHMGARMAAAMRAQCLEQNSPSKTPESDNTLGPGKPPSGGGGGSAPAGDPSRSRYISPLNHYGRDPDDD
jgi:type IV secretion system protein TrbL